MTSPILQGESFSLGPSQSSLSTTIYKSIDSSWLTTIRKGTHSDRNPHPIYIFLY